MSGTNTLAYLGAASVTKEKRLNNVGKRMTPAAPSTSQDQPKFEKNQQKLKSIFLKCETVSFFFETANKSRVS